jgi:hypothetical protein
MKIMQRASIICTAALLSLTPSLMAWQITATDGTGTIAAFSGTGACTTIGPLASGSQCLADSFTTKSTTDGVFSIIGSVDAVNTGGKFFLIDLQNVTITRNTATATTLTITLQQTFASVVATENAFDSLTGACQGMGAAHTANITSTETIGGAQVGTALNGSCTAPTTSVAIAGGLLASSGVNIPSTTPVNLTESITVNFNASSNASTVTLTKFALSAVPEPMSMTLFGSGLLGLAMLRRKIFRG